MDDPIDDIRKHLTDLHPTIDTSGFAVTGRILRLAGIILRLREEHLERYDLNQGDFDVLATIRRTEGDDGVNPRRLLDSVLITSGGLTKRLDRLEHAALISRHPDPDDRRGTLVRLTTEGREVIDDALTTLLEAENDLVQTALGDEDETDAAASMLRQLVQAWPTP
jgi:DNA-binding MarR family transcriptional regulator